MLLTWVAHDISWLAAGGEGGQHIIEAGDGEKGLGCVFKRPGMLG